MQGVDSRAWEGKYSHFPQKIFLPKIFTPKIFLPKIISPKIFLQKIFSQKIFLPKILLKKMFSKKYLKKTHQKYIFKNTDTKYFSKKMVGGEAPFAARRAQADIERQRDFSLVHYISFSFKILDTGHTHGITAGFFDAGKCAKYRNIRPFRKKI